MKENNLTLKLYKIAGNIMKDALDGWHEKEGYFSYSSKLQESFSDSFRELYLKRIENNYLWDYCSIDTYKEEYFKNLKSFTSKFKVGEEKYIIHKKTELNKFSLSKEEYKSWENAENRFYLKNIHNRLFIFFFNDRIDTELYYPNHFILNIFIENGLLTLINDTYNDKVRFLDSRNKESKKGKTDEEIEHLKIFYHTESNALFKELLEKIGNTYSDITFIYRKLLDDNIIRQESEQAFRLWLNKYYDRNIDTKLQQLSHVSHKNRLEKYNEIVEK